MNLYELHRDIDHTGVSGIGIVAEIVEFQDGTVVMRWISDSPSTVIYNNIETLMKIHNHVGTDNEVGTYLLRVN